MRARRVIRPPPEPTHWEPEDRLLYTKHTLLHTDELHPSPVLRCTQMLPLARGQVSPTVSHTGHSATYHSRFHPRWPRTGHSVTCGKHRTARLPFMARRSYGVPPPTIGRAYGGPTVTGPLGRHTRTRCWRTVFTWPLTDSTRVPRSFTGRADAKCMSKRRNHPGPERDDDRTAEGREGGIRDGHSRTEKYTGHLATSAWTPPSRPRNGLSRSPRHGDHAATAIFL